MKSCSVLEKFFSDNCQIPELSQVYHHVYFKSVDNDYLSINHHLASFLELPSPYDVIGLGDEKLILDKKSLKCVQENDQAVIKNQSIQIFNEYGATTKRNANFTSIKSPLYNKNGVIGIWGISLIADGYHFSDFRRIINIIGNKFETDFADEIVGTVYNPKQKEKVKLTLREQQCLHLYMRGYSAREVAQKLNLSNRTVEFYLENIKSKLNVNRRADLLSLAFNQYPELI